MKGTTSPIYAEAQLDRACVMCIVQATSIELYCGLLELYTHLPSVYINHSYKAMQ